MPESVGWFSDIDEGQDSDAYRWQPCIQTEALVSSLQIWFASKVECDNFIRDQVIPAGARFYDDPTNI